MKCGKGKSSRGEFRVVVIVAYALWGVVETLGFSDAKMAKLCEMLVGFQSVLQRT